MNNEHDDYLTKGEVFLASIGREPEDEEEQEELEEIFDDNVDDEDEDGDPSLAGVENYE